MFTPKKPDPARARAYRFAFHMAWPAVVESFFVSFAGLVDSLMVSSLGSSSVAAVGLTTQPKFISLCFFLALNVAIRSLRSTGAGALLATVPMRVLSTCMTFVLVTLLWVLFRSDTLGHALAMYATLFNLQAPGALSFLVNGYFTGLLSLLPLLLGLVLVFALPTAHDIFLGCRDGSRPWLSFAPTLPWALVLALAAVACLMVMDRTRPFLF